MYSTTLRAGEAVEIGDLVAVRVEAKSGCMVKLAFAHAGRWHHPATLPLQDLASRGDQRGKVRGQYPNTVQAWSR